MNHPLSASRLLSALFLLMAACLAATTGSPLRSAAAPPPPPHVLAEKSGDVMGQPSALPTHEFHFQPKPEHESA